MDDCFFVLSMGYSWVCHDTALGCPQPVGPKTYFPPNEMN